MTHKILVVEDFEPIRNMYVDVLQRCGYEPITAANGEDAMRLIYSEVPDIILLDVDLPRMSGLDILKRLRQHTQTRDIRVIMVTGNHVVEHSDNISEADLLLIKPVSPTDLVSFVRRLLPVTDSF